MTITTQRRHMRQDPGDAAIALVAGGVLKINEACALAKISRSTLYVEMAAGRLPYVLLRRARRIPRRALEHYLAERLE